MKKTAAIALTALMLAGCAATVPTHEQQANAYYGELVKQEHAQEVAKAYFETRLKDPDTAQYRFDDLHSGWIKDAPISGGKFHFGFILPVKVNAKNSYGGYTGYKPYSLLFRDDKLVKVLQH